MSIDNPDIIKRLTAEMELHPLKPPDSWSAAWNALCLLNGEGGTVLFGVTGQGKNSSDKTYERLNQAGYSGRDPAYRAV